MSCTASPQPTPKYNEPSPVPSESCTIITPSPSNTLPVTGAGADLSGITWGGVSMIVLGVLVLALATWAMAVRNR